MPGRLSIFGFGAFGRFMCEHLRPHFEIMVHDVRPVTEEARALGVREVSLADACTADTLVFAVPVQNLSGLVERVASALPANARPLALDVSSVKVRPVQIMSAGLPERVRVIGTHPLFGPQSGRDGIDGLPIALCPVRADRETVDRVRAFLRDPLRLRVEDVTPEEHDRDMAYVQGLTHLLSRALGQMDLPDTPLATVAYQRLLAMRANLSQDSWDLFLTIERENAFAPNARAAFARALEDVELRLREAE